MMILCRYIIHFHYTVVQQILNYSKGGGGNHNNIMNYLHRTINYHHNILYCQDELLSLTTYDSNSVQKI